MYLLPQIETPAQCLNELNLQMAGLHLSYRSSHPMWIPSGVAAFASGQKHRKSIQIEVMAHIPAAMQESQIVFRAQRNLTDSAPLWQVRQFGLQRIIATADYDTGRFPESILVPPTDNQPNWIQHTRLHNDQILRPFHNPADSLVWLHLAITSQRLMVHSSAVVHDGEGYLFAGFSGVGKSTMAGLWQQCGATVINDDRTLLTPTPNGVLCANSPMVYPQTPTEHPLRAILLLKQHHTNTLRRLSKIEALTRFAAFCIQHPYDKKLIETVYATVELVIGRVPVWEVGVSPTTDVVRYLQTHV